MGLIYSMLIPRKPPPSSNPLIVKRTQEPLSAPIPISASEKSQPTLEDFKKQMSS
jgi:hypothetical protein